MAEKQAEKAAQAEEISAEQEQALAKCCPHCCGSLEAVGATHVRCWGCNLDFTVAEINSGRVVSP